MAAPWKRSLYLLALLMAPGCVSTEWMTKKQDTGTAAQVLVNWEPQVMSTADTEHHGAELKGFAGRMYLFGPTIGRPFKSEGEVRVYAFDASSGTVGDQPMEGWEIDSKTLPKMVREDPMGWGYTLFLPWTSIHPGVTKVRMNVEFTPSGGSTLYATPVTFNLQSEEETVNVNQRADQVQLAPNPR